MLPHHNRFFIACIAIIMAGGAALIVPSPTAAGVDLRMDGGEAVWFFRDCQPGQPGETTAWHVDVNPAVAGRRSLQFQVENAYPGYQLDCDLHFANTGRFPIAVEDIRVLNLHPGDLAVVAIVPTGEEARVLRPCNSRPYWGRDPSSLSANCQSQINLALTIGPEVGEGQSLSFAVEVRLEEKPGGCHSRGMEKHS